MEVIVEFIQDVASILGLGVAVLTAPAGELYLLSLVSLILQLQH